MRLLLFCVLLVYAGCGVAAMRAEDGGGRDVSVSLFSTRRVQSMSVEPMSANAWTAACRQCAHRTLMKPLVVAGSMEVFAGGTLRVTEQAGRDARTATGLWHLRAQGGEVDAVLTLPSERYVADVLSAEAAANEPPQSLRALAVLARTYALNGKHYTAQPGHLDADLCDSTQCQAVLFQTRSRGVEDAVNATAGETLWFHGRRAEVYFSQSCGGLTEDGGTVWPRLRGVPYLQSHADPYCLRGASSAWHALVPLAELMAIAGKEGWHLPKEVVAARITERSRSRRALRITFTGGDGNSTMVSASALRFGIGRALGWNRVRSDSYEVGLRNGALVFDGRGHGHGVGLCQAGATEMAAEGKSAREILAFYFPGTSVGIAAADEGWQETRDGALTLRSTKALSAQRQQQIARTWAEAQRRFPPRSTLEPTVVFAPSSELFRQLTAQPGWALASTRGEVIVLQPESVFHADARMEEATLLHEMLHVLVEADCNDGTPLWLREGLVEALADPVAATSVRMSTQAMESALQHPELRALSEQAHKAAAAKVSGLLQRYGVGSVRGWLSSGVPAGVS
jgi:stage II sporulation protein D